MEVNEISALNRAWGVCGFTSTLTALYLDDPLLQRRFNGLESKEARQRKLLIEVVSFLNYVTFDRADLIAEINELNRRLETKAGQWKGIDDFVRRCKTFIKGGAPEFSNYQCALTPEALVCYLKVICGLESAEIAANEDLGGQGVLGLMNAADELAHWVYRDGKGNVHNWGKTVSARAWRTSRNGLGHPGLDHVGYHIRW